MGKGVDKLPLSTWALHYSTGRRLIISVLRTLNDSKRIPCVVGVRNPKVSVITGEAGSAPISKIHSVAVLQKSPFKVTIRTADSLFRTIEMMKVMIYFRRIIHLQSKLC